MGDERHIEIHVLNVDLEELLRFNHLEERLVGIVREVSNVEIFNRHPGDIEGLAHIDFRDVRKSEVERLFIDLLEEVCHEILSVLNEVPTDRDVDAREREVVWLDDLSEGDARERG